MYVLDEKIGRRKSFKVTGGAAAASAVGVTIARGFFTKTGKVEFSSPSLDTNPDAEGRPIDPAMATRCGSNPPTAR